MLGRHRRYTDDGRSIPAGADLPIIAAREEQPSGVFASLVTGTVATVVWKSFLEQPTGVSERLASYVVALAMAVAFSLAFPEKRRA